MIYTQINQKNHLNPDSLVKSVEINLHDIHKIQENVMGRPQSRLFGTAEKLDYVCECVRHN